MTLTLTSALVGGALIGLSTTLLLATEGKVAGISGIFDEVIATPRKEPWRAAFVAGLIVAGLVASLVRPSAFGAPLRGIVPLAIAGVLVGFGTRLGNGCTSGHGVAGLSRLSKRSFAATITFIGVGMFTTWLVHRGGG